MDDKRKKLELDTENEINFETKNASSQIDVSRKSEGNAPSGLGAIKNNSFQGNGRNDKPHSPLNRPIQQKTSKVPNQPSTSSNPSQGTNAGNRQLNSFGKRPGQDGTTSKTEETPKQEERYKKGHPKATNPFLNQNNMKGFGKAKVNESPKINASAPFLGRGKGISPPKRKMSSHSLLSSLGRRKEKKGSLVKKKIAKQSPLSLTTLFQAIPLHVKIAIGAGIIGFIVLIILIIAVITMTSSESGNREMLDEYIEGDYTDEELCHYLKNNGYISEDEVCEDTNEFQFFVSLKELKEEYESKYQVNRFQVNVQLLYETLFYFFADEDFYNLVTKEEMRDLIEASLEEIEETCVVKSYDQKNKTCTEVKYVYTLYEYSLDKYISYLKYGTSSTHPNYGHATVNVGRNGKSLARKCGTGKNTDYVFAYGFVNTSSSPISEGSNCPANPVTDKDYKELKPTYTSLEEMSALGGVPKYSHIYKGEKPNKEPVKEEVTGSGLGADIAKYALQFVGNPYVYGGTSLTKGADCSGFVQKVYEHFDIALPRVSKDQALKGEKVACNLGSLKAGDLLFYDNPVSHVAIYIGKGKIVHAKGAKYGIVTDKYDYSKKGFNTCKRIVK